MDRQGRMESLLRELKEITGEDLWLMGEDGRILGATAAPGADFLRRAAEGLLSAGAAEDTARRLGMDFSKGYYLLMLEAEELPLEVAAEAAGELFADGLEPDCCVSDSRGRLLLLLSAGQWEDPLEAASFLQSGLEIETVSRVKIGVSSLFRGAGDIPAAYRQAQDALSALDTFSQKEHVASWRGLGLQLAALRMTPEDVSDYLDSVMGDAGSQVLGDSDLMRTAEVFLETGLNSAETARQLCVHRNTLNYRLEKIEKLCGLDLKRFEDAAAFRVATLVWQRKPRV